MAELCLSSAGGAPGHPPPGCGSSRLLEDHLRPLSLHLAFQFLHRRRALLLPAPTPSTLPPPLPHEAHASAHPCHETAPAAPRPTSRPPNSPIGLSLRALAIAVSFGGLAGFVRALLSVVPPDFLVRWREFFSELSGHPHSGNAKRKTGSVIYDRHGTVIATVGLVDTRRPSSSDSDVRPSDIPAFLWQAVVASEDRRFFQHHGIDPRGIARAAVSLTSSGGGSTITQQVAKNLFLSNERKWSRKLVEMFLAVLLEKRMSKWDILHTYLKKIYWGHGIYGIEAASAFYFGKHPSMLGLGECAMLAGIIPAPELLSPYRDPSRGKKPQARILRRMVEAGFLDTCSAEATVNEPLHLGTVGEQDGTPQPWKAPFFVNEVLYELKQKYGCDRVFEGGLQVYTTLDLGMQEIAEKSVRDGVVEYDTERVTLAEMDIQKIREKLEGLQKSCECDIEKTTSRIMSRMGLETDAASQLAEEAAGRILKGFSVRESVLQSSLQLHQQELKTAMVARLEAAMVAIDPSDGAVRVLVGGRDYIESSFNRTTQAYRPPGSTFKPVVYLTALAEGLNRRHILVDEPYTVADFSPENYDGKFRGKVTMEESILKSLNVPTVKLCAEVGVDKVCKMGNVLGIESPLPHELTLALGGFEVTPLQIATVYSTIASGGIYHKPHLITRVETKEGQILDEMKDPIRGQKVVDEHALWELRNLLQAVIQRGTGRNARIGRPCAGKTGTSDGHRDVWFAGFTPDLTCVVWLGYDDNSTVGGLHPGTGASHAAPVWQHFMKSVYEDQPIKTFHDIFAHKKGLKSSKKSLRILRRRHKLHKKITRKKPSIMEAKTVWKDVWDWENASSVWKEREHMAEWTAKHIERAAEISKMQTIWQQSLHNWDISRLLRGSQETTGHGQQLQRVHYQSWCIFGFGQQSHWHLSALKVYAHRSSRNAVLVF